MAGQGKTTKSYAAQLRTEGWNVLYTCIPNSVHVRVTPIPTSHGVSKQRYPDIAAVKDNTLLLVEVEMSLSDSVVADIILRFTEMRYALTDQKIYTEWAKKVSVVSQLQIPLLPMVTTLLVIVNERKADARFRDLLSENNVEMTYLAKPALYDEIDT